jgi:hypothetical protein
MSRAPERTFNESFGTLPARELIGLGDLDSRLQNEIAEYGTPKGFHITMWRAEPDATGCNWNARVDRIKGTESSDLSWWNVVPQMRARFNLS